MANATDAQTFEYKGCLIHYWIDGPEGAPLVVFTPGAMMDHTMFDDQVASATSRYRVLRWDVRGHGLSRPTTFPFSTAQAAEDLNALLDKIAVPRVALVGQSIGGNISQDFIFRYPDRCIAALLLDCTCSTLPLSLFERLALKLTPVIVAMYPMWLFKRQSAKASSIKRNVRRQLRRVFGTLSRQETISIIKGVASALHGEKGYRIQIPILIAYGEQDRLGNIRKIASLWARRDPLSQIAVIPEAGHVANMDNPTAFNRAMMDFLDKMVR